MSRAKRRHGEALRKEPASSPAEFPADKSTELSSRRTRCHAARKAMFFAVYFSSMIRLPPVLRRRLFRIVLSEVPASSPYHAHLIHHPRTDARRRLRRPPATAMFTAGDEAKLPRY